MSRPDWRPLAAMLERRSAISRWSGSCAWARLSSAERSRTSRSSASREFAFARLVSSSVRRSSTWLCSSASRAAREQHGEHRDLGPQRLIEEVVDDAEDHLPPPAAGAGAAAGGLLGPR